MDPAQQNIIRVAIDSDSLVYKSCYRHQTPTGCNMEQAFLEFGYEIGKIKSAVFRLLPYKKGDKVVPIIVLSPKKTFRNDLSPDYKAKRPKQEQQPIHGIKALKIMIMDRLNNAEVHKGIEADDVVIWYAKNKEYLVSAIDKDVINACPTSCYNFNTRKWEQPHMPYEIEQWYTKQALMGDSTDGVSGAEGVGPVGAEKFVSKFVGEPYSWGQFVDLFGDEHLAKQAMNLVRMDRLHCIDDKLVWKPWEPFEDQYWEF